MKRVNLLILCGQVDFYRSSQMDRRLRNATRTIGAICCSSDCLLLLVASLLSAALAAPAAATTVTRTAVDQAASSGRATIAGRVIDAQSGVPVARARVRLLRGGSASIVTLTDGHGEFAFAALSGGSYTIQVEKPAYLAAHFPPRERTLRSSARAVRLTEGQALTGVEIGLTQASAIAGRVIDSYGDPIEAGEVRVMRVGTHDHSQPKPAGGGTTNDLGEFRIGRLEPGSYLLMVVPRSSFQADVGDVRQVPTFYPGVASLQDAQPVTIKSGMSATGLEIALRDGVGATVTGTVNDVEGQPVAEATSVTALAVINGHSSGWNAATTQVRADGTFSLRLPGGEYELRASTARVGTTASQSAVDHVAWSEQRFGFARVVVNGDQSGVAITVGGGAHVSGRIVFEGGTAPPARSSQLPQVMFASANGEACRTGHVHIDADLTFSVEGLLGTCIVQAGISGPWIVSAVQHDGKDLQDTPVTFESGAQISDIRVVVTNKRTEMGFYVVDEYNQLTRDYAALVFATDSRRWSDGSRYVRTLVPLANTVITAPDTTSASDSVPTGRLNSQALGGRPTPNAAPVAIARRDTIAGLPPGQYYVVALDDADADSIHDPEMLRRLSDHGVTISISEGANVDVRLRRFKWSDLADRR